MIPKNKTTKRNVPTLAQNPVLPTQATRRRSNTIIWRKRIPTSLVTRRPVSSVQGPGSFHGSNFGHKYWSNLLQKVFSGTFSSSSFQSGIINRPHLLFPTTHTWRSSRMNWAVIPRLISVSHEKCIIRFRVSNRVSIIRVWWSSCDFSDENRPTDHWWIWPGKQVRPKTKRETESLRRLRTVWITWRASIRVLRCCWGLLS